MSTTRSAASSSTARARSLLPVALLAAVAGGGCANGGPDPAPSTAVTSAAPLDATTSSSASWMVGERSCEKPTESSSDDAVAARFVEPTDVRSGDTVTVRMNQDIIDAAIGQNVEARRFGNDFLYLECWDGTNWVPTWLVRIPGFSDAGGSSLTGLEFEAVGVSIDEPYDVSVLIPAGPLPVGDYRWSQSVGIVNRGEPETVKVVQPFTVIP